MTRYARLLLAVSAVLAAASKVSASSVENILTLQGSVRQAGMGNAFTAVSDDVNAMFANPAGLGIQTMLEVTAAHRGGIADISQDDIALVYPLSQANSANVSDFGTVGVAYGTIDYGSFEGRGINGAPAGGFTAKDELLTLGYGKAFGGWFSLGVLHKMYRMDIESVDADGSAVDAGLLIRPFGSRVSLGASIKNMGSKIRFGSASDELPRTVAVGAAVTPIQNVLTLSAEAVKPQDLDNQFRAGLEWWANSVFALRGGYDSGIENGIGVSGGFGICIRQLEVAFFPFDRIMLDYAFTPADEFEDTHRFALSMRLALP